MKPCLQSPPPPLEPNKAHLFDNYHIETQRSFFKTNEYGSGNKNGSKCSPPSITHQVHGLAGDATDGMEETKTLEEDSCGREKLKRHRIEVAGRVWIPDIWDQEGLLKDWIDCSAFDDASLVPNRIVSARAALVEDAIRANSGGLRLQNRNQYLPTEERTSSSTESR